MSSSSEDAHCPILSMALFADCRRDAGSLLDDPLSLRCTWEGVLLTSGGSGIREDGLLASARGSPRKNVLLICAGGCPRESLLLVVLGIGAREAVLPTGAGGGTIGF